MATTVKLDWTTDIRTKDGFVLIPDIDLEVSVIVSEEDGAAMPVSFVLTGHKYDDRQAKCIDTQRFEFDGLNGVPEGLYGMIMASLMEDDKLSEAACEEAGLQYFGKGPNDPDGFFKMEAAE